MIAKFMCQLALLREVYIAGKTSFLGMFVRIFLEG